MSKSFAAKLLLILYIGISCRPMLPVLADMAAHILFYKHHYATVHQHGGQFHVHDEIATITKEDSGGQEKSPASSKNLKINELSVHTSNALEGVFLLLVSDCTNSADFFYAAKKGIGKLEVLTPPPNPRFGYSSLVMESIPYPWLTKHCAA